MIAFAKTRGLKTVNIVRRPELVTELKAIGGDVVVVDSPDVSRNRSRMLSVKAELRLALDGVSGPATGVLAATLSPEDARRLRGDEPRSDVYQPAGSYLQASYRTGGFWLGHPEAAAKSAPAR